MGWIVGIKLEAHG